MHEKFVFDGKNIHKLYTTHNNSKYEIRILSLFELDQVDSFSIVFRDTKTLILCKKYASPQFFEGQQIFDPSASIIYSLKNLVYTVKFFSSKSRIEIKFLSHPKNMHFKQILLPLFFMSYAMRSLNCI